MIRKTLMWALYLLVCGAVVVIAANAGRYHDDCTQCARAFSHHN
ncbi:MAG TPA: hypothetical protein VFO70_01000 [Chitinophagaceae bacterium]|nr:hypothetical protein [Chitinophagaceae bacterium]